MLWGNLETFEQNPVKRFRNRNPNYKKGLKIFFSTLWDPAHAVGKAWISQRKKYLKFIAYIMQSTADVASRAESQKAQ